MRTPLAVVAGAAVAALAAVVLGEYAFDGWAVIGSGLLVGLFVAEAMTAVAGRGGGVLAAVAAVLGAGAMLWAGWISTGGELGTVGWKGWVGVVLAAAAGAIRARPPGAARRTPPAPASTE